jgi:hypothetical protein
MIIDLDNESPFHLSCVSEIMQFIKMNTQLLAKAEKRMDEVAAQGGPIMSELEAKAMEAICVCCGKKLKEIDMYAFKYMSLSDLKKHAETGLCRNGWSDECLTLHSTENDSP